MSHTPAPQEVRAAREAAELTQAEAAALVYLGHPNRWSEIERGVYPMHSGLWELFRIKTGQQQAPRKAAKTA
jgi:transcriptional regulator with XRE-family HTH domain